METNIGIDGSNEKAIGDILNVLLSDEYILLTKTRNYHWHIKGPSFIELHRFYEDQYDEIKDMVDAIAERVTQLGQQATATLKEFVEKTRLTEGAYNSQQQVQIRQLLNDHESICRHLRDDIQKIEAAYNDPVTVDQLTKYLGAHEKMAWMLRSYLA